MVEAAFFLLGRRGKCIFSAAARISPASAARFYIAVGFSVLGPLLLYTLINLMKLIGNLSLVPVINKFNENCLLENDVVEGFVTFNIKIILVLLAITFANVKLKLSDLKKC